MAKIQFDTQFKTPYITSYGEKQQKKNKNEFVTDYAVKAADTVITNRNKTERKELRSVWQNSDAKIIFEDSLKLELNVIGYHDQGESVVFFIKTDGMVAQTGLVDCYKTEEQNAVKMVLEKERIKKVDFVCWTHPHDDHTRGLDEIWKEYCTKETCFCCSDIIEADLELYSKEAKMLFESIADIHTFTEKGEDENYVPQGCYTVERLERQI